ncbi:hypothetical protein POVCU2_0087110 [Plasmodium ovale curtisi]|uniref:Uncharacterized protein n=1 Tax=Plasmodium ovale curtisi TaxID=864141 RepID=A0A1A8X148_PLAOA|nr:hypothetical protein POVCU2_0087110 [Plasmodium ovale curtisi]SBS97885.1 hypothetical protein POVCU1_041770 [Plasmodium ovale curtisi]
MDGHTTNDQFDRYRAPLKNTSSAKRILPIYALRDELGFPFLGIILCVEKCYEAEQRNVHVCSCKCDSVHAFLPHTCKGFIRSGDFAVDYSPVLA